MNKTQPGSHSQKPARREERRSGTQNTIEKLVAERTEMLALFCRVAGADPYSNGNNHKAPARELLQEFLQVLVDYLAAGHFSLYERIANGSERRRGIAELAQQLYPRIAETTQKALDFNDGYDGSNVVLGMSFHDDLSKLGELLATRIDLEDKLIERILH